ncbi:MAG: ABC transporter substrate-binding protein [Nitrososphaerota archaeon]|nr:ABC transporter substrate-binding protein [Nitrososphaerota archaeon]MDG6923195.1 ABC transporter substrate-binding protein [Nitrososphaerota archaeon]
MKLSLCCGYYDRTKALFDGTVKPEGIELAIQKYSNPDDLFRRTLQKNEFDVSELSFSNYIYGRDMGGLDYIALPVFPSKKFRHHDIYVNKSSKISSPKDLNGKKILVYPSYYVTAALFQRGVLQHDYGVKPESITWLTGKEERIPIKFPSNISAKVVDPEAIQDEGSADVMMGPATPVGFPESSKFRRLFPDAKKVEIDYYRKTGIYPIMHVLVVRESIWKENKWIAKSLVDAFSESKKLWKKYTASGLGGLAWIDHLMEEEREILSDDPYPCDIEHNRKTIETLIQYCSEQAVMKRVPKVEELFASP